MIRISLLGALVAFVACSKAPRTSHEEAPVTRPLDAPALDAPAMLDAPVLVDAAVPPADAAIKKARKLGALGDVCARGARSRNDAPALRKSVLECGPGLQCCYPCGIPGCDSVCKKTCPAVP